MRYSESEHLFFSALDQGRLDRISLLLEGGHLPPCSLVHRAVSIGVDQTTIGIILDIYSRRAKTTALAWRDISGESAVDVAFRVDDWETVDLLKKAGAQLAKASEDHTEDRTSSQSLMKAIALGRQYKLEPVASLFKENKK